MTNDATSPGVWMMYNAQRLMMSWVFCVFEHVRSVERVAILHLIDSINDAIWCILSDR